MPFELSNAPDISIWIMKFLKPYVRKFLVVYFHNILVYSKIHDIDLEHIRLVFETLQAEKLFINLKK